MPSSITVDAFTHQQSPLVYVARIPGPWLLKRTTPSWRIDDPELGFQRVVREDRARAIAIAVLEQGRTFPNAIVLATDAESFDAKGKGISISPDIKFLVVDGQHRLWAQNFSDFEAHYACLIHMGLSEVEMAELFLEINDNQKRVPSSLRWDLVRLVRPDDDPQAIEAAELVFLLTTEEQSPLYQRIDLTGEQSEITLKQGSLAPEIKRLLRYGPQFTDMPMETVFDLLVQFFNAVKNRDPDGWGSPDSSFYKARVIRALVRMIPDIAEKEGQLDLRHRDFLRYLKRISEETLDPESIRAKQGNAGIAAIYRELHAEIFGEA